MPFFSKFLNFFNKSNVQHANQRLEAVHQLHPQTPEGRQALEALILTETQIPLLEAAILQLNDLAWVFDQCTQAAEPQAVQNAALPILCGQAPHSEKLPLPKLEQRLQLLEHPQCQQAWLLQKVVQEADNLELRLQALARLSAQQTPALEAEILAPIALENTIAQVRLQAAQGIHSEAVLEQLVRLSVRDKGVLRLAKERLAHYKADATARAQALQQRQQLLDKICTHARTSYTPLFAAKFRHLVKEWQQLDAPLDEATEARYQEARLVCEKTIADQEAREHAERQAVENQARVQEQQAQVIHSLQEIHAHLDQYFDLSATGLASLQSQLEWQQKHWQSLQQEAAPKPDTLNAYQAISQELAQATLALEALKQVQSQLVPLLTPDESMEVSTQAAHLDKLLTEIPAWPANLERPPLLEQAYAYLKQAHQKVHPSSAGTQTNTPSALENQLAHLLEECRQRLDAGETQAGIQTYSHAQDLWQQLGSTQAAQLTHTPLEQTYKALHARISELKDWQGFVAQPKREQLCQRMEALVDDQMEPQLKAERIHALQQEWKQLGKVGVHKALWTRFKQAADQAYAPCQAYFAEEAKVREYHRQQRNLICEELEALVQKPEWQQLDLGALTAILQKARQEWQRFHPVSRKAHRPLQKRFEQAIAPLQTHLDQTRHQSAAHKESLIEQARILLTLEDVFSAAQQAKQLQQEWKNIAPLNRRQEREYWHEFRGLCDQIFAHRDQERQQQKAAYAQAWHTLSEQIQALAHQVAQTEMTTSTHADFLRQHQALTHQLAELPAKHAQNKACSQALLQIETQLKQQQETLARAPFWSLWQRLSTQAAYADVQALETQVQQYAQPDWQPQLVWWRQAYALATPAQTLEEQQKLYVRFKLLSGQALEPEYQALKMSIQVERLTQGLGQNTPQEAQAQQTQELLALVISWLLTSLDTPEVLQTSFQQSFYAWCHPEAGTLSTTTHTEEA